MHIKFKYKNIICILTIISILIIGLGEAKVNAETAMKPSPILNAINYRFTQDVNLKGVFGNYIYYFNVGDDMIVKNSYLDFIFTQSQLILKGYSTATFYLNENPVYTLSLDGLENYKENVKIPLPSASINNGFNQLEVSIYRRVSNKPCTDEVNEGNWFTINSESFIHLDFVLKEPNNNLSQFPYPFISSGDQIPMEGILMLPDNCNSNELTSAMNLSSVLGEYKKNDDLLVNVYRNSECSDKENYNIIFIGNKQDTPKEILDNFDSSQLSLMNKSAVTELMPSPYNKNKKLLAIVGNNSDDEIKLIKLLSNKEMVNQIAGDNVNASDIGTINTDDSSAETQSLKDLGYGSTTLTGYFRQVADFNVSIPKSNVLKGNSGFTLYFRYSKNLDFDRSLATIYVNNVPIGSKKLTSDNADNDSLQITFPEDARNSSTLNVRVAFDLEMKNIPCDIRQEQNPWAYILDSSYFYLPNNLRTTLLFENYPSPFVENRSTKDLLIILPDAINSSILTAASNISAFIGHQLSNNDQKITVIRSSEYNNNYSGYNAILLGTPDDNNMIKKVNTSLPLKYDKSYNYFTSNDKVSLLKEYSKELTAIELIKSPYNASRSMMVVTSPKTNNMLNAISYLWNSSNEGKLSGDVSLINSEGLVSNYDFSKPSKGFKGLNLIQSIKLDKSSIGIIIFLSTLFIIICVFFTYIIIRYKKK